jgi:hypothetical protein
MIRRMKQLACPLAAALLLCGCPKPPASDSAPAAAAAQTPKESVAVDVSAVVGTWTTADEQGQPFDIVLFPGGQAVSTRTKGSAGAHGTRGFWRTESGRVLVFFQDGWTAEILAGESGHLHRRFEPGADLGGKWKSESPAQRLEGDGFTGIWQLNKEPDGTHLYVALQSSGRAFSTIGGGTEGKWTATRDGALCTWPDGWNDLISTSQDGYQKRSWVGPAEQNTTPPDISPAVRVGTGRFSIAP